MTNIFSINVFGSCVVMLIIIEVILWTVSGYSYTYEWGEAGVKLLTH